MVYNLMSDRLTIGLKTLLKTQSFVVQPQNPPPATCSEFCSWPGGGNASPLQCPRLEEEVPAHCSPRLEEGVPAHCSVLAWRRERQPTAVLAWRRKCQPTAVSSPGGGRGRGGPRSRKGWVHGDHRQTPQRGYHARTAQSPRVSQSDRQLHESEPVPALLCAESLGRICLCAAPTASRRALCPRGPSRQECWGAWPCPPLSGLPNP